MWRRRWEGGQEGGKGFVLEVFKPNPFNRNLGCLWSGVKFLSLGIGPRIGSLTAWLCLAFCVSLRTKMEGRDWV